MQDTGIDFDHVVDTPFWQLFLPPYEMGGEAWDASQVCRNGLILTTARIDAIAVRVD